jgi:YD repeat-containing protein
VILEINSTQKDNLGNVSNNSVSSWRYNADGTISYASRENGITPFTHTDYNYGWREYDAQGRLVKKRSGWSLDRIDAIVTYTYDTAGNLTKEHVKTNSGEQEYTYSYANGRLAKIAWQKGDRSDYTIEYFYDAAGNLVKEEWTQFFIPYNSGVRQEYEKKIMEYVYANGKRVSGTYTMQALVLNYEGLEQPIDVESVDQYTYTCDEQGRVLTVTVIPGNTVDMYGEGKGEVVGTPGYESKTYEYTYGNYYIYTPAN